jgi:hypothetical protein
MRRGGNENDVASSKDIKAPRASRCVMLRHVAGFPPAEGPDPSQPKASEPKRAPPWVPTTRPRPERTAQMRANQPQNFCQRIERMKTNQRQGSWSCAALAAFATSFVLLPAAGASDDITAPVHRLTLEEYEGTLRHWKLAHPQWIARETRGNNAEGLEAARTGTARGYAACGSVLGISARRSLPWG